MRLLIAAVSLTAVLATGCSDTAVVPVATPTTVVEMVTPTTAAPTTTTTTVAPTTTTTVPVAVPTLDSLSVEGAELVPAFDPAVREYQVSVVDGTDFDQITVNGEFTDGTVGRAIDNPAARDGYTVLRFVDGGPDLFSVLGQPFNVAPILRQPATVGMIEWVVVNVEHVESGETGEYLIRFS